VVPEHEGFPRELGRYGKQDAVPLMICIGGMHGNEPAGVFAAQRMLGELKANHPPFRGTLIGLAGNRPALESRCRYLTEDFNRMWFPERLAALRSPMQPSFNPEEIQCRELSDAIETALMQYRGPVVFLDLHTTSADGVLFAIVSDTIINRTLAMSIAAPVILLEEQLDGTLLNYMNDRGLVAVGFEGGQNDAPSSVEHNERALWAILVAAGCLKEEAVARAARLRAVLQARSRGYPPVLEVRCRHAITPADQFVMEPGFVNFQPVKRGQLLVRDRHGEMVARENGRILLRLYQNQGSDGFFLVREISPRWLRLFCPGKADAPGAAGSSSVGNRARPSPSRYTHCQSPRGALVGDGSSSPLRIPPSALRGRKDCRHPAPPRCHIADPLVNVSLGQLLGLAMLWMGQGIGVRDSDWRPFCETDHRFDRVGIKGGQGLMSDVAEMRSDSDIIHCAEGMIARRRLDVENVNARAGNATGSKRRNQIGFDNYRTTRRINQISLRLHQSELAGSDQPAGPIAELNVDRKNVGEAEQVVLFDATRSN
jgi:succinylglutamate desuccinylase